MESIDSLIGVLSDTPNGVFYKLSKMTLGHFGANLQLNTRGNRGREILFQILDYEILKGVPLSITFENHLNFLSKLLIIHINN